MKPLRYSLAALALAAALAGCSAEPPDAGPGDQPQATTAAPAPKAATPTEAPPPAPAPAPVPAPSVPDEGTARLGHDFTYTDGLKITVVPASTALATDSAFGAENTKGEMWLFDITVTNGTGKVFDPSLFTMTASYGASGTPAAQVYDSAFPLDDRFPGPILAGKKATIRVGFAIPTEAPSEAQINVTPSFQYQTAPFVGQLVH